jgi:hypothetical protein
VTELGKSFGISPSGFPDVMFMHIMHIQDFIELGAPGRTRTCGQVLRRHLLYPLSYGGGTEAW